MKLTFLESDEFYPMYTTHREPYTYTEYVVELPEELLERLNKANAEFEATQAELRAYLDAIPDLKAYPYMKKGKS